MNVIAATPIRINTMATSRRTTNESKRTTFSLALRYGRAAAPSPLPYSAVGHYDLTGGTKML